MSEGWGDFIALLLLARAGDNLDGAYPFGVYTTQSFSADPAYFGIRRAPYSANHDDQRAVVPPHGRRRAAADDASVQRASATTPRSTTPARSGPPTLWEGYVALQKAGTSFDDDAHEDGASTSSPACCSRRPTQRRPRCATRSSPRRAPRTRPITTCSPRRSRAAASAAARSRRRRASTNFVGHRRELRRRGPRASSARSRSTTTCRATTTASLDAGETCKVALPIANAGHKALDERRATLIRRRRGVTIVPQPAAIATLARTRVARSLAEVKLDAAIVTPLDRRRLDARRRSASEDGCETRRSSCRSRLARSTPTTSPRASATDTFDAHTSVWTRDGALDAVAVEHERESRRSTAHGTAPTSARAATPADVAAARPSATRAVHGHVRAPVQVRGRRRRRPYWDGGVIEYSTDGGATWEDVSTLGARPATRHARRRRTRSAAAWRSPARTPPYPAPDTSRSTSAPQLAGKPCSSGSASAPTAAPASSGLGNRRRRVRRHHRHAVPDARRRQRRLRRARQGAQRGRRLP